MLQDPSLPCEIVPALAWAFQESNESIAYESSGYSSPFTQSSQSCHGLSASPKRCLRVFARRERLRRTGGRRDPKAHEALSNRVLAEHHDLLSLPSSNSQLTAPSPSPIGSQCRLPRQQTLVDYASGSWVSDTDRPRVVVKRVGEQRGDGSSREAFMHSQNTLIRSDLTTPWRGSAVSKEREAKNQSEEPPALNCPSCQPVRLRSRDFLTRWFLGNGADRKPSSLTRRPYGDLVLLICLKPLLIGGVGAKTDNPNDCHASPSCVSQPADGLDQCCHPYALFSPNDRLDNHRLPLSLS
jgi:hypothetical protein